MKNEKIEVKIARLEEKVDHIGQDIKEAVETMKMTSKGMNDRFDEFNQKFDKWKENKFQPLAEKVASHHSWIIAYKWLIGLILGILLTSSAFYAVHSNNVKNKIANIQKDK